MTSERQISRHWRLNSLRYRLVGFKYPDGEVSLQNRPKPLLTLPNNLVVHEVVVRQNHNSDNKS
ncbi:hypothetical protein BH10PAT1_BH10PAT1_4090 [soil metagenome]